MPLSTVESTRLFWGMGYIVPLAYPEGEFPKFLDHIRPTFGSEYRANTVVPTYTRTHVCGFAEYVDLLEASGGVRGDRAT